MKNDKSRLFAMFTPTAAPEGGDEIVILDPLDTDGVKKSFDTVSAQKKHWREKAVDPVSGKTFKELYEAKVAEATAKPLATATTPEKGEGTPAKPDADWLFDNIDAISSLTPDERTELRTTATDLNVDPVKFIKSKAGQAQLKEIRALSKSQTATPSPSNSAPTFNGKPIKDVLTDEKATPAEKQAAYLARFRGTGGANRAE